MPSSYQPHISPPSRHGSRPAICTLDVTKAFATGSRSSTASAASRSLGSRTREVVWVNTGGASHWGLLISALYLRKLSRAAPGSGAVRC